MFQLLLRAFYALHDTRTPALINVVATAVNIGRGRRALPALPPGHAWSGSRSGSLRRTGWRFVLTARALGRRLDGIDGRRVTQTYVRVTLASAVAGGAAFGLAELTGVLLGRGVTGSVVALVAGGGIGLGILATAASRMRISEATANARRGPSPPRRLTATPLGQTAPRDTTNQRAPGPRKLKAARRRRRRNGRGDTLLSTKNWARRLDDVAPDAGDVILSWLTRVVLVIAATAVVGFDGLSIAVAHVSAPTMPTQRPSPRQRVGQRQGCACTDPASRAEFGRPTRRNRAAHAASPSTPTERCTSSLSTTPRPWSFATSARSGRGRPSIVKGSGKADPTS